MAEVMEPLFPKTIWRPALPSPGFSLHHQIMSEHHPLYSSMRSLLRTVYPGVLWLHGYCQDPKTDGFTYPELRSIRVSGELQNVCNRFDEDFCHFRSLTSQIEYWQKEQAYRAAEALVEEHCS